ncbi:MAG TPA: hypothetical protein VJ717_08865 [Gemmatimonadaceae bacterium]|nr:hypothetical protein [Gemmatimonadaceae bacterium]
MYTQLDPTKIIATVDRLERRIVERFPEASLRRVAAEISTTARHLCDVADSLRKPHWPLRVGAGVLIAALVIAVVGALVVIMTRLAQERAVGLGNVTDVAQGIEAAVNDAIFLGVAIYFILSLERRTKRRVALRALHQLRSLAHVVDMHQLTKDPDRLMHPQPDTASSPDRTMTVDQMGRYLDYCSELLSLLGKVAALFPQRFDDSGVLEAASDIENLTIGLSRKVWQKITMLQDAPA